jgi:hypothetical protein
MRNEGALGVQSAKDRATRSLEPGRLLNDLAKSAISRGASSIPALAALGPGVSPELQAITDSQILERRADALRNLRAFGAKPPSEQFPTNLSQVGRGNIPLEETIPLDLAAAAIPQTQDRGVTYDASGAPVARTTRQRPNVTGLAGMRGQQPAGAAASPAAAAPQLTPEAQKLGEAVRRYPGFENVEVLGEVTGADGKRYLKFQIPGNPKPSYAPIPE